ncbi:MAG TPA: flagellar biosynthetic protein FliO [Syntrophobacteraceae bacterium]|nr:flagellar biosynthetic protein FliO [Syntrophobacteraceae bacterium]
MENALDVTVLSYRVFGSLAVVLAVLFAAAYCFKRLGQFPGKAPADKRIRLLARQSVGPKHHLVMVEAADRLLLLGISPEGIRLLSPLGEVSLPVQENQVEKEVEAPPGPFQNILDHMTGMKA